MTPAEIELKLRIEPADAQRVADVPGLLAGHAGPAPAARLQCDAYYDTADRALLRQGIALRVRQRGDSWVQTIKRAGNAGSAQAAGLAVRDEWEWPLPGPVPDPGRLTDIGAAMLAATIAPTDLRVVYSTRVERQSWLVWPNAGTAIEVAVDVGSVAGARGEQAFAEVEFELKRGRVASLYSLAQSLQAALPARLSVVTKAELGLQMAYGLGASPVKADMPTLSAEMSVANAFRLLMRAGIGQLLANLAPSLRGEDPEGIHQMRVAMRRLRTVISLFSPVIASSTLATQIAELRWLGQVLGDARDLDVLATETLPALATHPNAPDLAPLAEIVAEARQQRGALARAELAGPRFTRALLGLCFWVEGGGWNDALPSAKRRRLLKPIADKAAGWLERQDDKLRSFAEKLDWGDLEQCHALRKKFKKLRYSLEFVAPLFSGQALDTQLAETKALQESFGALNDSAVALSILAPLAAPHPQATEAMAWVKTVLDQMAATGQAALQPRWQAYALLTPVWQKAD